VQYTQLEVYSEMGNASPNLKLLFITPERISQSLRFLSQVNLIFQVGVNNYKGPSIKNVRTKSRKIDLFSHYSQNVRACSTPFREDTLKISINLGSFLHPKVRTSAVKEPLFQKMSTLDNPPPPAVVFYGQPLIVS